ncbi:MAG: ATP-binding protein [Alphaproteobacteria bacterium]|nr:ATP-binding protein [Alphaproteobacteria bacterium]
MSPLLLGALLLPAFADDHDSAGGAALLGLAPPACWEDSDWPAFGLGVGGAGRATGARHYGDVQVISPSFHVSGESTWLGDVDRLARFDVVEDNFTSVWESEGAPGLFAFAGDTFYWSANKSPSQDGTVEFTSVDLSSLTVRSMSMSVRSVVEKFGWDVATAGHRWHSPMGLLGIEGQGPDDARVLLVVEFTRSSQLSTGVIELAPVGDQLEVKRGWLVPDLFDRFELLPGAPGEPDLLLLIDNSTYLSVMALTDGEAAPVPLNHEDVSSLAVRRGPSPQVAVGTDAGCVTELEIRVKDGRPVATPLRERPWCAGDEAWGLESMPVRGLSALSGGRWLVSLGEPRHLLGDRESEEANLRTFMLAPPEGAASRLLPLPVAEAVELGQEQDSVGSIDVETVLEDHAGRVWASARQGRGRLAEVRRLDLPFTATASLVGGRVLQQVPFGETALALVEAPDGSRQAWTLRPELGQGRRVAVAEPWRLLALLEGEGEVWAIAGGEGAGALLRFVPGQPAGEVALTLPELPDGVVGFRLTEQSVIVEYGARADGAARERAHTRAAPSHVVSDDLRACEAPDRLPSFIDGVPVCVHLVSGEARWGSGVEGKPLIPAPGGGWWTWRLDDQDMVLGPLDGGEVHRYRGVDAAVGSPTPLGVFPDPEGRPWLYVNTRLGVERYLESGGGTMVATREEARVLRDLRPGCRDRGTLASARLQSWFVDAQQNAWATLAPEGGGHPVALSGPVMPYVPEMSVSMLPWEPIWASAQPKGGRYDPRIILRSTCEPGEAQSLRPGPLFDLGFSLFPSKDCIFTADNVHFTGTHEQRHRLKSALGISVLVGIIALALSVIGLGVRRYQRQRQEVVDFAEQVKIPYIAGPPVSGEMFFGRERLVSQLMSGVKGGGYYALLADDKRIGKSSLLLRIHELLRRENEATGQPRCFPVYYTLERASQGRTFFTELWRFISELVEVFGLQDDISVLRPEDESEAFMAVLDLLNALHHTGTDCVIVLLFDEFQILAGDHASPAARDAAQRLRSLTAEACRDRLSWVGAGVASLLNPRPRDMDSDLLLVGPRFSLGVLETEEARSLIRDPVAELPVDFEKDAEDLILAYSRCHPFVIQYTCRTLLADAALTVTAQGKVARVVIDLQAVKDFTKTIDLDWLVSSEADALPAYGAGPLGAESEPEET